GDKSPKERLVFLYKLKEGCCPKSYGLQVASLAGLPAEVVTAGSEAAVRLEESLAHVFEAGAATQSTCRTDSSDLTNHEIAVFDDLSEWQGRTNVAEGHLDYAGLLDIWHRLPGKHSN
ncbi:hypothetical protein CYMTET_32498, partial [Cymbomonas tetramitiformis]